jgi:hypothetical protein
MRRRTAVTALGIAGIAALGGGQLLHHHGPETSQAHHALESGRRALKRRADALGFMAYVMAVNRRLPERGVVLEAYRAAKDEELERIAS